MSKHTPGPWKIRKENVSFPDIATANENDTHICRVTHYEDARLIAAAPELLEIAHWVVRAAEVDPLPPALVIACEKLLARIEGGAK